jgi:hypothetical protein
MKVFISWSGDMSKAVAEALRDWLPLVIQAVEPWVSSHDIERGVRWSPVLTKELEQTKVGIICLTPDNLEAPWILFEAGALSKTVDATFVCPFLFRVENSDLEGPLAQFQTTKAQKDDTRELMHTINKSLGASALREGALDRAFEKWWPDLEQRLGGIPIISAVANIPKRTDRQILDEILELVRNAPRTISYSVAPPESGTEDPRLVAIKAQLFDQSKRFLSSCLDHLVDWQFENGQVVFRFTQKDSLYADLLKAREQQETLRGVCAQVLGQPVTIRVEQAT